MAKRANLKTSLIILVLLPVVHCITASATTIYVDANTPDNNDGSSWTMAYKYLQDALVDANSSGDVNEIWVAQGIYTPDSNSANPNGTGDRTATFQFINNVAIRGGYAGYGAAYPNARDIKLNETVLSGDLNGNDTPGLDPCDLFNDPNRDENSYHVITANEIDANTVLDGFTITAGNANGSDANGYGGGLFNDSGSPTLVNCIFLNNFAQSKGGGMYAYNGSPMLINCSFLGNWTQYQTSLKGGGGLYVKFCELNLINCLFSGNFAGSDGGAIHSVSNSMKAINCTFSQNQAYGVGAGIYAEVGITEIKNCIFWDNIDNLGSDEWSQIYPRHTALYVAYSCIQGWSGSVGGPDNINLDPCFVDVNGLDDIPGTKDDDLKLWLASPCIDAGDNNSIPADISDLDNDANTTEPIPWDIDGYSRFVDDTETIDTGNPGVMGPPVVDMGAYEYTHILNITRKTSHATIQSAIDNAEEGDVIVLSPGTYTGDGNYDIEIDKTITLRSEDPNDPNVVCSTIVDVQGAVMQKRRGFSLTLGYNEDCYLDGITIKNAVMTGGPGSGPGGGIYCHGGSPVIRNCVIENCTAIFGGGIFYERVPPFSSPLIENCTIKNCSAGVGGGVAQCKTLKNCTIEGNTAIGPGGGVYDCLNIQDSSITNNTSETDGGGIYYSINPGLLENCVIAFNTATLNGGGIYCSEGTFSNSGMINCEIFENTAYQNGGGMFKWSGSIIQACAIVNNVAGQTGGGICRGQPIEVIYGTTIGNNEADFDGGGIMESDIHFMEGCAIELNRSLNGSGGAICSGFIGEILNSYITGNAAYSDGGGAYNCEMPLILYSEISNNESIEGTGGAIHGGLSYFDHCLITGNTAVSGGGIWGAYGCFNCTIVNNTASNSGAAVADVDELVDCIIWDNNSPDGSEILVTDANETIISYCDVKGGISGVYVEPGGVLDWRIGNINVDPCFADEVNYYLKSQAGRYDIFLEDWVYDSVTSRCVGAAYPNKTRHNLGVYGRTDKESKSPVSWSLLGDLTNNGIVDIEDLQIQTANWLVECVDYYCMGELDDLETVDFADFALLAQDWLNQTIWYQP